MLAYAYRLFGHDGDMFVGCWYWFLSPVRGATVVETSFGEAETRESSLALARSSPNLLPPACRLKPQAVVHLPWGRGQRIVTGGEVTAEGNDRERVALGP